MARPCFAPNAAMLRSMEYCDHTPHVADTQALLLKVVFGSESRPQRRPQRARKVWKICLSICAAIRQGQHASGGGRSTQSKHFGDESNKSYAAPQYPPILLRGRRSIARVFFLFRLVLLLSRGGPLCLHHRQQGSPGGGHNNLDVAPHVLRASLSGLRGTFSSTPRGRPPSPPRVRILPSFYAVSPITMLCQLKIHQARPPA